MGALEDLDNLSVAIDLGIFDDGGMRTERGTA
jgi:hypothetical protein